MRVIKIGGAVLKEIEGFAGLANLLRDCNEDTFVVISALKKTTRMLEQAAALALNQDWEQAQNAVSSIIDYHINICMKINDSFGLDLQNSILEVKTISVLLSKLIKGVFITKQLTNRTKDWILSLGEDLAITIANGFLNASGINAVFIDAKNVIVTNDEHGTAQPDFELTSKKVKKSITGIPYQIFLIQGFVGSSISGYITTMGMESSNLTASLLATITKSHELIILTDVDGISTIDPKLSDNAKLIKSIELSTAKFLAESGLKLIYPTMLDYMKIHSFNIIFRSLDNLGSTLISNCSKNEKAPIIVVNSNRIVIANIDFLGYSSIHFILTNYSNCISNTSFSRELSASFIELESDSNTISIANRIHDFLISS